MKSTTFAISALLTVVAVAQPHRHHQHAARHQKRDVVWVTQYDYETETVGYTTTIWVSEGQEIPTSTAPASTTSTSSPSSSSASATPSANQFFEGTNQGSYSSSSSSSSSSTFSPVYVAPTPSSIYVAPTPSSVYVAPTTSAEPTPVSTPEPTPTPSPSSVYVAPAPVETPSTPAYVAPVVESTPSPVSVAAVVVATPASSPASSSSGSTGGACSSGSPCEGDITYYEAGLGACGITSDGNTDKVIALPVGMMGSQSNGNPFCGKSVTISLNGKTVEAVVADKCMGCSGNSIDLSNAAFQELADFAVGRTQAEWWFN